MSVHMRDVLRSLILEANPTLSRSEVDRLVEKYLNVAISGGLY